MAGGGGEHPSPFPHHQYVNFMYRRHICVCPMVVFAALDLLSYSSLSCHVSALHQPRFTELCCLDLSVLQRPVLSLDVPVLQQLCFFGIICPAAACDSLDVPVLHQPELTLDMYVLQQPFTTC
jgi:hypothetical protein